MNKKYLLGVLGLFIILLICFTTLFILVYMQKSYRLITFGQVEYYQNSQPLKNNSPNYSEDVKKIIKYKDSQQLINFPSGYSVNVPLNMNMDFNYSPAFVRVSNSNIDIKISREYSPYTSLDKPLKSYLRHPIKEFGNIFMYMNSYTNKILPFSQYQDKGMGDYFNDYLVRLTANPEYQKANSIKVIEDKWINVNGYKTKILSLHREPLKGSTEIQNDYLFAFIITGKQQFYSFLFRTDSIYNQQTKIYDILNSFNKIPAKGVNKYNVDLKPVIPKWNKETQAFYDKLNNSKEVLWGFFIPGAIDDYSKVAEIEKKIDYKFPILLKYSNLGEPFEGFPTKGMKEAYKRNQVIELTMQISYHGNDNSPKHNANFDLLDGKFDQDIRKFARDAKAFGHPFLFRLNNEMNTDWCQYSGVLLMSDPDIYIKIWRKIYNIFEQEGVDNAIWIFNPNFNPNSSSYPPTNWNADISYYPGNEYVQLLGITGYNTGNYFKDVTGETWHSFDQIYAPMAEHYRKIYGKFPWIITEFASSSVGGNKAQWIRDMFKVLPKYPEIKAAVWWSYYDPDYREEGKVAKPTPARRYWLEEKDEYLQEFKNGIKNVINSQKP